MTSALARAILTMTIGLSALGSAPQATAQDWPAGKPVKFIVAHGPGSSTDILARIVADKLGRLENGSFVAENKPGAGGNIASVFVKRAPADGYTILVNSVSFAVNPSLYANAGYDAIADFLPVALGPRTPNLIAVNPATPANSLPELVELARKTRLNYASSGIGTTTHLSVERLKTAAKIDITHVPYQPAQAVNAVVAGETQMSSTSMPPAVPQVQAGKLRAIAVTSAVRSPLLPNVPSITEFGYKEFDDYTWFGFFAPVGTPAAIVERLNARIGVIFEMPDVQETFGKLGFETKKASVKEFGDFVRAEVPKWAEVVKSSGAKAE